jgi:hypothetical protein
MRNFLAKMVCVVILMAAPVYGQKAPPGIWEGYDGEWLHVSEQLVALAAGSGGAVDERSVYAYCGGEFLSVERDGTADACRP